jgi:RHS repeat-associated protein
VKGQAPNIVLSIALREYRGRLRTLVPLSDRRIRVNYPGTGNYSQFSYDGNGRKVKIVEIRGGSVNSTRQFIYKGIRIAEARDASSNIISRYFSRGQTISAANYFYNLDQLGSIRELTDTSGAIQGQLSYDPFGRSSQLQGSLSPDFQYAGYYAHTSSTLLLSLTREYSPSMGRWLSRDMIGESSIRLEISQATLVFGISEQLAGPNLYNYVRNLPISRIDPTGQKCDCYHNPLPPRGPDSNCGKYGNSFFHDVSEKCVCECMGNSDSANLVRGCLWCEKELGKSDDDRHVDCLFKHPDVLPTLLLCVNKCIPHPEASPILIGRPPLF